MLIHVRLYTYVFLSVSFNLGPDRDGVEGDGSSSSIAITGGLVARGEGPWLPSPKDWFGGRREPEAPGENKASELDENPNPPEALGDAAGGLIAAAVGKGALPELNSAHRGHFRLVSAGGVTSIQYTDGKPTHSYVPFDRNARNVSVCDSVICIS